MTATAISALKARRVWDSRGRPTLEVEMQLASGATGRAIAPAGASMGSGEAVDLRDGGSPFGGLGVVVANKRFDRPRGPHRRTRKSHVMRYVIRT